MNYLLVSLLSASFILVLFTFLVWLRQFLSVRHYVNQFPGPYSYYIFGNTFLIIGSSERVFKTLRSLAQKWKTYRLWIVAEKAINITLPEDIEAVISTTNNITKSSMYEPLKQFLGTGLLISDGSKWHTRRKILTPAFHFNILQQFVAVFVKHAEELVKQFERHVNETSVDVMPYVTTFTLSSVCETAMGTRLNSNSSEQISYKKAINTVNNNVQKSIVDPLFHYLITRIFMPGFWQQKSVIGTLHSFTNRVISDRKKTFKKTNSEHSTKRRLAMLDLLLSVNEENGGIDDEGIREEVDTFMFEGHDTTSMCLSFTLMLLANNKDAQAKIYEEVMEVFGQENREPSFQDLQDLHYLELCLKESLRLYPSVPLFSRISTVDVNLPSGYLIPKGVTVVIHTYDLHHNPDIYPDPEKFDPERFLPENSANRHPFAYLPFSGGPRNCIGQRFALLELKTAVSAIVRKFELEPVDTPATVRIGQEIVLRPKNGVRVKLVPRKQVNCWGKK